MNNYIKAREEDFGKIIDFFRKDIATLRVGRANPLILEGIMVEAYGVRNPLNTVVNIAVSDAQSLVLTPWDKTISKDIEKAIVEANLGLGVYNEGDKIRLTVPAMTEENRLDTVKKLNERQEKARVSARQLREEIKTSIETAFDDKEIGEDDKFRFIKDLDEAIANLNDEIKSWRDKKETEIMEI